MKEKMKYNIGDIRNGYPVLEQRKRKTILLLSDDLRMTSGIGVMSKEFAKGTCHQYNWVQLGAAIKHPDKGKIFDLSQATMEETGVPDTKIKVFPHDGYGNPEVIREIMNVEKPDAILHFTDPRQWVWLYQMEHEIRQQIPLFYYNIWDCPPAPLYNRDFYRSCDLIMNISRQTHALVQTVLKKNKCVDLDHLDGDIKFKDNTVYVAYVPHGINEEEFKHIPDDDPKLIARKKEIFGEKELDFIVYWNNRNIRRKMPGDLIIAFKKFVDNLPDDKKDRVALLMHTAIIDQAGTNLAEVINKLAPNYNIIIDTKKWPPQELNLLYAMSDITVNIASNEGFGLSSAESLMAGRMILNNVTGGLQDQIRQEDENGNWWEPTMEIPSNHHGAIQKYGEWALPVFPKTRSLVGSVPTPYILDDRCDWEDVATQLRAAYDMGRTERIRRGLTGRKWVTSVESCMSASKMSELFIKHMNNIFDVWTPKKEFKLYTLDDRTEDTTVVVLESML